MGVQTPCGWLSFEENCLIFHILPCSFKKGLLAKSLELPEAVNLLMEGDK